MLVNNAMVSGARTAVDATVEEFDRAMAGIPRASFLGAKYAIPEMIKGGAARSSASRRCTVCCRRAARSATRSARRPWRTSAAQITVDYAPQGIRANVICPGGVQSRLEDEDPTPESPQSRYTREIYPARRLGWPRDIANACLFFASDEASWVTGQVLAVDGGLTNQLQDDLGFRLADYLKNNPDTLAEWTRR